MMNYAEDKNYAVGPATDTENFVSATATAHNAVADLIRHVEDVAGRLAGQLPPAQEKAALSSVPSGHFGEVRSRAAAISSLVAQGHDALNRIENTIPPRRRAATCSFADPYIERLNRRGTA